MCFPSYYLGDLVTCIGDREIQSLFSHYPGDSVVLGELAQMVIFLLTTLMNQQSFIHSILRAMFSKQLHYLGPLCCVHVAAQLQCYGFHVVKNFYFLHLCDQICLYSTVPVSTYHTLAEFFGTNACMDEFKGRPKKTD